MRIEPAVSVPSARGDEAGRDRRAAAAARAAADALGVPGVARRAEVRARRQRAEGELVRVQLADDRRAGRPQPRDDTSRRASGTWSRGSSTRRSSRMPATSITSLTRRHPCSGPRAPSASAAPLGATEMNALSRVARAAHARAPGLAREAHAGAPVESSSRERRQDRASRKPSDRLEVLVGRLDALRPRRASRRRSRRG